MCKSEISKRSQKTALELSKTRIRPKKRTQTNLPFGASMAPVSKRPDLPAPTARDVLLGSESFLVGGGMALAVRTGNAVGLREQSACTPAEWDSGRPDRRIRRARTSAP